MAAVRRTIGRRVHGGFSLANSQVAAVGLPCSLTEPQSTGKHSIYVWRLDGVCKQKNRRCSPARSHIFSKTQSASQLVWGIFQTMPHKCCPIGVSHYEALPKQIPINSLSDRVFERPIARTTTITGLLRQHDPQGERSPCAKSRPRRLSCWQSVPAPRHGTS